MSQISVIVRTINYVGIKIDIGGKTSMQYAECFRTYSKHLKEMFNEI